MRSLRSWVIEATRISFQNQRNLIFLFSKPRQKVLTSILSRRNRGQDVVIRRPTLQGMVSRGRGLSSPLQAPKTTQFEEMQPSVTTCSRAPVHEAKRRDETYLARIGELLLGELSK